MYIERADSIKRNLEFMFYSQQPVQLFGPLVKTFIRLYTWSGTVLAQPTPRPRGPWQPPTLGHPLTLPGTA